MAAPKLSIKVVTRLQDNGDGGYTFYAYNSADDLIADHLKADEMTPKLRKQILNGEDEYENGYIGKETIEIKMVKGKPVLASPLSFHAGQ